MGWRAWGLSNSSPANPSSEPARQLILTSTFMVDLWHPGKPLAACCGSKFLRHGVHAFITRDQAQQYIADGLRPLRYVFGEVSLWGRVVIHERGYRAQFAYPRRIFVPRIYRGGRDFVNELRRAYGVEAEWTHENGGR